MPSIQDLPALNATLNALSAVCLCAGYACIRRGHPNAHRACMIGALVLSAGFLISYVVYHYHVGSRPFTGEGVVRRVYFVVLVSHVLLAMAIVPLVAITVTRALRHRFQRHAAIARWTLPLWLYVSVTGVIVYGMLYGF